MSGLRFRVGILATHPIQYYAPWYRALAAEVDLDVFFSHRQSSQGQARAGYGQAFDWDVPLLDGYRSTFLENVARRPDVNTFFGCDTPSLARLIHAGGFDAFIVHGWSTKSYWQAMRACRRAGIPVIVRGDSHLTTPRAWWWRTLKEPLFRAFIPRFDAYLTVGSRAREYLLHYGADPARCFASPHCVDNAFFAQAAERLRPARAEIRAALGLPNAATVFLLAGRLVDIKRVDLFIDAVAAASARAPSVRGLVVGDGPLRHQLERHARRRGAPIVFAGFLNQTEMPRAYVAADCLVVSSTAETWALVVNEAMASGIPAIVSTGTGCAGDLVVPGSTGDVFATGDAPDLARHLTAFAADPAYAARLAERARTLVQDFDASAAAAGAVRAIRAVTRGIRPHAVSTVHPRAHRR